MGRENGNTENLHFQLKRLQAEGKSVGGFLERTEQTIFENSQKRLERPRWEIRDEDKGMRFYKKGTKRMDILEGVDEYRGIKYKDIIIYDSNFNREVLVRTKKEPLNGKTK
jgi:hypothetical protein